MEERKMTADEKRKRGGGGRLIVEPIIAENDDQRKGRLTRQSCRAYLLPSTLQTVLDDARPCSDGKYM